MKILMGVVADVIDKGEGDKRWAIVGINCVKTDRDGFQSEDLVKLRVFGDQIKNGIHNAYRQLKGQTVFVPFNDEFDGQYSRISYSLAGLPLKLAQQQPAPIQKSA